MLSSQYGTKSLRSVSGTVCESVLQPVETLGLKQMSVFPIRSNVQSLSHSEHRSCRVTRVWIKRAGQVWLLYKERTFIVEFPTPQMRVTRSRLSFDWFQWFRRGENSHACHTPVHTPAHLHARAHTHTHAHSEANNRTYVHSLDTYKNWNTNTNNTTIKTLYCLIFFFRNSYSYVLYSVERQLCFNKWTLFFCLSLKWSVGYHHHNENSYSIYLFF